MKLYLPFSLLILVGCASSVTYQYASPKSEPVTEPTIKDQRSEKEKKAEVMSANKSNCWFGIYRLGDDQIKPGKLKLLAGQIQLKMGTAKVDSIKVNRFEIYNNIQLSIKGAASAFTFGLVSAVPTMAQINSGGCSDAFDLTANPGNKESVVVLYDIELNGKRIIGKKVQIDPEIRNGTESVRSPTTKERINRAIAGVAKDISEKAGIPVE